MRNNKKSSDVEDVSNSNYIEIIAEKPSKNKLTKGKDPAMLLYTTDFLIESTTLDFSDRGYFITLLCLLHQHGRLEKRTVWLSLGFIHVCPEADFTFEEFVPKAVLQKFKIDSQGRLYSPNLEVIQAKRQAFVLSRQRNGAKGGRPRKNEV